MTFLAYPEYKPSGFDWLPEVPAHWVDRKIARDIPFVVGWTPPSGKDEYYDGDLPWVTIADMTQVSVEDTKSKISHLAVQDKGATVVPAGSMLFSFKLSVGKVAFLTIDSYTNEAIAGFLPCGPLDLEYWKYAAPEFIPRYGRENIYGATLLNQELISSVRFFAPARAEQTQIARFLDHETARIDALIAEQQRLIELLKEKRQAVISQAVTKGLDPTVPMKDSGADWLGEVPAHWRARKVKRLFTQSKRQGYSDMEVLSVYRDYGVIKKSSRDDNNNKTPEDLSLYQLVESGDLVVNKMKAWQGSLGVSEYSGITSPDYVVYRPHHDENPRFIHHALRASHMPNIYLTISNGIRPSQWRIEPDKFEQLVFFLPNKVEQLEITAYLEAQAQEMDELMQCCGHAVDLLTERRSALISAAVTGKIDVRDWQPPARTQAPELAVAEAN